jgi:hypothetical protein
MSMACQVNTAQSAMTLLPDVDVVAAAVAVVAVVVVAEAAHGGSVAAAAAEEWKERYWRQRCQAAAGGMLQ